MSKLSICHASLLESYLSVKLAICQSYLFVMLATCHSYMSKQLAHLVPVLRKFLVKLPLIVEYRYMVSVSEEKILDFVIKSQQGELIQKEGKQTQKLKIGDKTYRYNKNKPASKVLNTRLKEVVRSDGYRKHSLLMKGASFIKLTRGRPLQDYVKRFKSKSQMNSKPSKATPTHIRSVI